MRKSKLCMVCLMSILFISVFGVGVASAKWKNYSFYNYSGRAIMYLYITASGYDSWGSDILGSGVLYNGDSASLRYNDINRYYDVKIVFLGGDELILRGCDYRHVWRKTLYHKSGTTYTLTSN